MVTRTEKATSWHDAANSLRSLVNREGYVPIRTRLASGDLDFLEGAREELLDFAALGLRLLDLHQPRDAGGITSDTANPILRCRSCMWRWPCPTFRAMAESLGAPRAPTSCQHVEPDHEDGTASGAVIDTVIGTARDTVSDTARDTTSGTETGPVAGPATGPAAGSSPGAENGTENGTDSGAENGAASDDLRRTVGGGSRSGSRGRR